MKTMLDCGHEVEMSRDEFIRLIDEREEDPGVQQCCNACWEEEEDPVALLKKAREEIFVSMVTDTTSLKRIHRIMVEKGLAKETNIYDNL